MKNNPSLTPSARARLEAAARTAAKSAYAPYSRFRVGSAVLAGSGKIYSGCNVENAAYGMCTCAERTAVLTAISAGEKTIDAVAVYTPTKKPTSPCGGCRQIINEFGPEALVISVCDSALRLESFLSTLLPSTFGPKDLFRHPR